MLQGEFDITLHFAVFAEDLHPRAIVGATYTEGTMLWLPAYATFVRCACHGKPRSPSDERSKARAAHWIPSTLQLSLISVHIANALRAASRASMVPVW